MDDWNSVTVLRGKQGMKPGAAKSSSAVNAARRRGDAVDTQQKYAAGKNTNRPGDLNTARLDQETEELKHNKVRSRQNYLVCPVICLLERLVLE